MLAFVVNLTGGIFKSHRTTTVFRLLIRVFALSGAVHLSSYLRFVDSFFLHQCPDNVVHLT